MIEITTLNGRRVTINAELIEMVERVPETLITLTTGRKMLVKETPEEVKQLVLEYRRLIQPPVS
ncbi:MAG TPA: endoflagellar protein [Peptococcaceae bacterium]|nr:MAG: Flagellar [Clostridia bacterium 41_269]HBT20164.1 endoflagellar protein [Peptococcaceae bacterium]